MRLTLEQLALWLSATYEADFGPITAEQEAAMLGSFSKLGHPLSAIRRGCQQGVNDRISQMELWSEVDRQKVDALLAAKGLPSIRRMEVVLKKKHQRILARGKIRNEEEYYIVKEVLDCEMSALGLTEDEVAQFTAMKAAYEGRAKA
jgi:hypothetical protein